MREKFELIKGCASLKRDGVNSAVRCDKALLVFLFQRRKLEFRKYDLSENEPYHGVKIIAVNEVKVLNV